MLNPATGEGSDKSRWVRRRLFRSYVLAAFLGGIILGAAVAVLVALVAAPF